jgi:hypothetical protein
MAGGKTCVTYKPSTCISVGHVQGLAGTNVEKTVNWMKRFDIPRVRECSRYLVIPFKVQTRSEAPDAPVQLIYVEGEMIPCWEVWSPSFSRHLGLGVIADVDIDATRQCQLDCGPIICIRVGSDESHVGGWDAGILGRQAKVDGVQGTWAYPTRNVNVIFLSPVPLLTVPLGLT